MKCTAFSMILAVPLLVGAVAVEPRDRLLVGLRRDTYIALCEVGTDAI
jgi:hypothetical protein